MFCSRCGKELHKNAHFCPYCGSPAGKKAERTHIAKLSDAQGVDFPNGTNLPSAPNNDAVSSTLSGENTSASPDTAAGNGTSAGPDTTAAGNDTSASPDTTAAGNDTSASPDTTAAGRHTYAGLDPTATDTSADHSEDTITAGNDTSASPDTATAGEDAPSQAAFRDFILKKGKIIITNGELRLDGKHYARKRGQGKFHQKKTPSGIPLDSILDTSVEHYKYGGRIFLSFLLLMCFAAGVMFSASRIHDTYRRLYAPYRQRERTALERVLSVIDNDGSGRLLRYQDAQRKNRVEADALSDRLAQLEAQQTREILEAVCRSDRFDLDDFFHREPFSGAYQDYLQDLLNAFKSDSLADSWLYGYYRTAQAYGGNDFLDTDMWIYNGERGNRFSSVLDSAPDLMVEQYDLDLYEHIQYTGRIYVTGAEFLQKILALPRYVADGAIFAKAHGGIPDAAQMYVPGWSESRYEEFWIYGMEYYTVDTPMWLDYGIQAADFPLDWNALIDERAYYDAYVRFMDRIAPGLPRYEMASYHADNTAYGGMGFHIGGTEASFDDMVAVYAETHPEFMDELKENKVWRRMTATSVDGDISETEALLEKLENEFQDLREQEEKLARLLADEDIYRGKYARLLTEIEQHAQELASRLMLLGGTTLLCALSSLLCLCVFLELLKRPRHLFLIRRRDMEYAFRTKGCSIEQITQLQNCLSA